MSILATRREGEAHGGRGRREGRRRVPPRAGAGARPAGPDLPGQAGQSQEALRGQGPRSGRLRLPAQDPLRQHPGQPGGRRLGARLREGLGRRRSGPAPRRQALRPQPGGADGARPDARRPGAPDHPRRGADHRQGPREGPHRAHHAPNTHFDCCIVVDVIKHVHDYANICLQHRQILFTCNVENCL